MQARKSVNPNVGAIAASCATCPQALCEGWLPSQMAVFAKATPPQQEDTDDDDAWARRRRCKRDASVESGRLSHRDSQGDARSRSGERRPSEAQLAQESTGPLAAYGFRSHAVAAVDPYAEMDVCTSMEVEALPPGQAIP